MVAAFLPVLIGVAAVHWLLPAALGADAAPVEPGRPPAFFELRKQRHHYAGPGREAAEPPDVAEVLIGYFGPCDPVHPEGGDMWAAAQLAVDEANRCGGYDGKPFRLVPAWSENPWGSGISAIARMVYEENVWAVVGGIDGPSTHLAEQVVVKARLALVSPASADKSVNLAGVPWAFSCLPGDHLQAPVLAKAIAAQRGGGSLVLLSGTDHDCRVFTRELLADLSDRGLVPELHLPFKPSDADFGEHVARVLERSPGRAIIIADAHQGACLTRTLRDAGFGGTVYGGPSMGRRRFLEKAGPAAEGVVFPLLYRPGVESQQFERAFEARFHRKPDYPAAHAYDAVRLVVAAVREAGLNRARIYDALVELSPWEGVTGTIEWDSVGSNRREADLGTFRDGRVVPVADAPTPAAAERQTRAQGQGSCGLSG